MVCLRVLLLTFLSLALTERGANAQLPRLSFDLTLGPSIDANSGQYIEEGVPALVDLSFGVSFDLSNSRRLILMLSHGSHGKMRTSEVGNLWPDGTCCVPYFPAFTVTSVLGGIETNEKKLRVLGGLARASDNGTSTVGLTARVDGSLPLIKPLWAVASIRGLVIPDFNDDRFWLGGFSVGLGLR